MLNVIQDLHDKTKNLVLKLEGTEYEELIELVSEREKVLAFCEEHWSEASQEYKDKVREVLKSILDYDPVIVNRMQELKDEAEHGLKHFRKLKIQKHAYESQSSEHSMFFDKKN